MMTLPDALPVARIIVQPDDGVAPVVELIAGASRSVRLKMFTFTYEPIITALKAAHDRGVSVRVMLNPARSSGSRANDETMAGLRAAGIEAIWSNPAFPVTHEKSMVIDEQRALIATFNFVEKYFTRTRDYGAIIEDQATVAEILQGFDADWNRQPFWPRSGSPLVWSNTSARTAMCAFIDSAQETLWIQHPKFVDATVLDRIVAAQARGVAVRILCGGRHGISEVDLLDTFSSLRIMQRMDIAIHKQKTLRAHAKLMIADKTTALIGSMNIDRSAFDIRRELGIVLHGEDTTKHLREIFKSDWKISHRYDPPDPLTVHLHVEDDHEPHDIEVAHE
ncbi:phospholipase D-like domain-containing protein [Granulibacter bethesdensis]|uniref:Phospholipase D n=1 Tax=Granulibacter bethesdensis (strain ATCC BAA-1260 / CGDNIH1) TaxID=391165 RepID=Q0BU75_GRABC|nr:phospholipase D-like domain-containing protein [Granulibacter bethesdensis]ABI61627.1 Cardiolipin synthetase [Granulibacter bethesdensis CGDNIH1]APH51432.1 Cardiolipin synthetase [Granulibacter bethesdensis]APH64125.1 Cardiolipin synthetase [Granulibacter bethesdensis]